MISSALKKLALLLLVLGIAGTLLSSNFKGKEEIVDMASFPVYSTPQQNSLDGWVQFRAVEMTHIATATETTTWEKSSFKFTTQHSLYVAKDSMGNTLVYDDVTDSSPALSTRVGYEGTVPVTLYGRLSTVSAKFSHFSDFRDTLEKFGNYDLVVGEEGMTQVKRYTQTDAQKTIEFLLSRAYYLVAVAAVLGLIGAILDKAGR